jgi:glycosyltransferase involved in cell wall biosynthesis
MLSVACQSYKNVEYIIIDGGSSDGALQIINRHAGSVSLLISEADKGIYDAMNKGIRAATGDVIGMLNADDFFADDGILGEVAQAFTDEKVLLLYGDLDYVDANNKTIRKWRSGNYTEKDLKWGWMPPHPTFYCRRELFGRYGGYSLEYGSAADYELMLRFMLNHQLPAVYLRKVMVKMEIGGESNRNLGSRMAGLRNDRRAMGAHAVKLPWLKAIFKRARKIGQFFSMK